MLCIVCSVQSWLINDVCFSAKGERGGSEGEEDLEEITDSAEESDENDEQVPPPATTAQVTTPTPSVRHTGRPGVLIKHYYLVCSKLKVLVCEREIMQWGINGVRILSSTGQIWKRCIRNIILYIYFNTCIFLVGFRSCRDIPLEWEGDRNCSPR